MDFLIDTFENIKFEKYDLIVSNMSLCFCNPNYFQKVCRTITNSILPNGYFVGNFLGKEDGWSQNNTRSFTDEKELRAIFKDFQISYFKEKKYNKQTANGNMKFWHVYEIIAKKVKKHNQL